MSTIDGAAPGDIWTKPLAQRYVGIDDPSDAKWDAANGITDKALYDAGNAAGTGGMPLDWLDTLSGDQLNETTVGNFEDGPRITTYGELKKYRQVQSDIVNLDLLPNMKPTDVMSDNQTALSMHAQDLMADLWNNKSGAIAAIESFVSSAEGGVDQLPPIPLADARASYQAMKTYEAANPHGNWAATDDANAALKVLKIPFTLKA